MKLIEFETNILESDDKSIVLTSHRIRQENKQWGKTQIKSVMLEHVTSCEYDRKSFPVFLLVGFVLIIFGAYMAFGLNNADIGLLAGGAGLAFVIFYWITIRKGLIISSPSAKIIMNTNGMKDESIRTFIDKLEDAKSKRFMVLKINN